jgi:3-deoxy-D-manno-octulosonic-acid transferase
LGAPRVVVSGNLKFDVAPNPAQTAAGQAWRQALGRPVMLLASTREGEEEMLLKEAARLPAEVLLVVVPRHPQRFDEVARLLDARGLRYQRRSEGTRVAADTRVLLGDSMGEMFAYYAACDVAFVGGSLLPYGAQNLIEPCAVGKPVLIGPSSFNFTEAAEGAVAAGAAIRVADAAALVREAGRLLRDHAARERMSRAGLAFCELHRGATARVVDLIKLRSS